MGDEAAEAGMKHRVIAIAAAAAAAMMRSRRSLNATLRLSRTLLYVVKCEHTPER